MLKLHRAAEHVGNVRATVDAYLSERPYRLMIRSDANTYQRTTYVKQHAAWPKFLNCEIGDAIHNMRSALDHIMWQLVSDKTEIHERHNIQFPFAQKLESLDRTIENRKAGLAGKNVVNAIKELKPYRGGNEILWTIHELDVADKHHGILTTMVIGSVRLADFDPAVVDPGNINVNFIGPQPADYIPKGLLRPGLRAFEEEHELQPTFTIALNEGQPVDGLPLYVALATLLTETDRAIRKVVEAARAGTS